jgi:hypothetical protein
VFRVVVCGSRPFSDYALLARPLDTALSRRVPGVVILSGGARGADRLAERYARDHGLGRERFPADWARYGRAAGPRRNEEMIATADALVAFWDGASPGTRHAITTARRRGIITRTSFGRLEGLPDPQPGVLYLTSALAAQAAAASGRTDVVMVDDPVRDDQGRVIGARALALP